MAADISWDENLVAHERWCNDLAVKFLCIFVLDRFGDFVSDQVGLMTQTCLDSADLRPSAGCRPCTRNGVANTRLLATSHAAPIGFTRAQRVTPNDPTGLPCHCEADQRQGLR